MSTPTPLVPQQHPNTPPGCRAAPLNVRRGSRQAVVGIQALWLHVVNCRERREGLSGWEMNSRGAQSSLGGVSPR